MGSTPDPGGSAPPSFDDFQRQTSLMTSCTLLWKELSDHFSSLERDLIDKSNALKERIRAIDDDTKLSLESLEAREASMANSMAIIMESLENSAKALADKKAEVEGDGESESLFEKLRGFCVGMCSKEFWSFVITKKKDLELLRSEIPKALSCCVDPPRFVLEAVSDAFPVNNYLSENDEGRCNNSIAGCNGYRNHGDMGWACVLLLECLVPLPVLMDPILGKERMIVTPRIKGKAEEIAEAWKKSLEERGGIENVKTPDVHTFLQHLVTFAIVKEEDADFYRKLVVGSAWRKQMPKLAVALGLEDKMPDMIEELIGRGQQVDAVHFIYEVRLADKFPPVPLLKAFLKDAKKLSTSLSEDPSGRASQVATKKEQSAIRAVLRCIQEYKLESKFPPEDLSKRLEMLDKAKKKHPTNSSPSPPSPSAAKRTRGSSGGPMPPAKAGRSTNASYVSSFPSPPTAYVMSSSSPTHHTQYPSPVHAYPVYAANHSPPPYGAYSPEIVGSYSVSPVNFPAYGGYGGMAPPPVPVYQQVYY